MVSLLKSVSSSEGLRSTAVVTIGNVVSTGLGAVAMIMAFRLVTPAEFGIFSAIFALMMIVVKIADLGTNIAMQKILSQPDEEIDNNDKKAVWGTVFLFKFIIGLLLIFLTFVFSSSLSSITNLSAGYLLIGVSSALGMIIYDQLVVTAQALQKFGLSVAVSSLQSVLKIIGLTIFYILDIAKPSLLIVLYGLAPLLGSLLVPLLIVLPLGKINWEKSKKMIWHIARFSSIAILSAAMADNIDILMIQSMLGGDDTGIYSAAARIASFVAIVGYATGTVLSVRVAKYKTKEHLTKYLRKAAQLAAASIVLMLISTIFAKPLILFTAGSPYLPAVTSLRYLLAATGLVMATSPYSALFYTLDKPQYFAISGVLISVLLLTGNYLFIPLFGLEGAGIAKLATRIIIFIFTYWYSRISYREIFYG